MTTLLLDDTDVRRAVDQRELVNGIEEALRDQARGGAVMPPRMNLESGPTWLRVMPAMVPSAGVMGLKVFHGVPEGGVRYLVALYDMNGGSVLGLLDACYLTAARTAATSAVAARRLGTGGPVRLGVLGSGLEAQTHCEALATVNELTEIRVYSPRVERRHAFAEKIGSALGVPTMPCERPEVAVAEADLIVVATNTGPSMAIACRAEWLSPGQLVLAIGSTNPNLRELDTDVLHRADRLVFDADPTQVAEESADVMAFCAEGGSLQTVALLPDLLADGSPGEASPNGLTVFKSVGTAVQDVVAAAIVHRRAKGLGLGVEIPEPCLPKVFTSSKAAEHKGEAHAAVLEE